MLFRSMEKGKRGRNSEEEGERERDREKEEGERDREYDERGRDGEGGEEEEGVVSQLGRDREIYTPSNYLRTWATHSK